MTSALWRMTSTLFISSRSGIARFCHMPNSKTVLLLIKQSLYCHLPLTVDPVKLNDLLSVRVLMEI